MKVINCNDLHGTDRAVEFTGGISLRPILASDSMGFSFCETHIPKGGPHMWHYENHLESCYCVSGTGQIKDLETGSIHAITPGCIYLLDDHQRHTFTAFENVILVSVFNPPLTGKETHDENGVYGTDKKDLAMKIAVTVNECNNLYDAATLIEKML